MQKWASQSKQSAFIIVELLIVIVVIAILAAITIVAYTGIQERAKASAVSSAASQAGKQALAYAPTNNDLYPTEAEFQTSSFRTDTLHLPADTSQATYDYYASDDQKSFCLSVTDTTTDPETAYAMTQNGNMVQGRCVENLVGNPSFETNTSGWGVSTPTSIARPSGGQVGSRRIAVTRTTSGDTYATFSAGNITANTEYFASLQAYGTGSMNSSGSTMIQEQGGGYRWIDTLIANGTTVANTWTRYAVSLTTPSDLASSTVRVILRSGPAVNDVLNYDAIMLTKGNTDYTYGDGTIENWSWTGTPHNSTSFGPALPQ